MSKGALVLAYCKEGGTFSIVSGYESGYTERKSIPIGTANDEEFAKQDEDWIKNTDTQYVIDHKTTAEREGRYSIRRNNGIFGFPKGGIKDSETPLDTAIREFREEVGYELDRTKLKLLSPGRFNQQSDYSIYTYNVPSSNPNEKKEIDDAIKVMKDKRKGELFDVQFRTIAKIKEEKKINGKSRSALSIFEKNVGQMGGSRKSKTRRRKRAKRQTLK